MASLELPGSRFLVVTAFSRLRILPLLFHPLPCSSQHFQRSFQCFLLPERASTNTSGLFELPTHAPGPSVDSLPYARKHTLAVFLYYSSAAVCKQRKVSLAAVVAVVVVDIVVVLPMACDGGAL